MEALEIFNKLIDGVNFVKVIQVKESYTSNSAYVLALASSGDVYQIAISDHEADNHDRDVMDDVGTIEDVGDVLDSLKYISVPVEFWGVDKADKYTSENIAGLVGSFNLMESYATGHSARIVSASLLYDSQVLSLGYDNGETCLYANFLPEMGMIGEAYLYSELRGVTGFDSYYNVARGAWVESPGDNLAMEPLEDGETVSDRLETIKTMDNVYSWKK